MSRTPPSILPGDRDAFEALLEPGETIASEVALVGGLLILTDRRLHLVRMGARYRRRTGVRSWPFAELASVRVGRLERGAARVTITGTAISANAVVAEEELAWLGEALAEVRASLTRAT